jgi:protein-arginine kinase activator protein McsA
MNANSFNLSSLDSDLDIVIEVISTLIEDTDYLSLLSDRKSSLEVVKCIHHPGSNSHTTAECRKSKSILDKSSTGVFSIPNSVDSEVKVSTTESSLPTVSKPSSSEYICKNCHLSGHYFKDCPQIQCTNCNKYGHIQRNCPDKEVKSSYSFRSKGSTTSSTSSSTTELNCLEFDDSTYSMLDLDKWYNSFDLLKIDYIKELYPYLVKGLKDGEEIQSLNYNGLIGILVKEIQELKQRLSDIELRISNN